MNHENNSGDIAGGIRLEMQKSIPSEVMERMLRRLQGIEPTQIKLQDFITQDSNDGKSILLTLMVNFIVALRPELGETQWAWIAAHAASVHGW